MPCGPQRHVVVEAAIDVGELHREGAGCHGGELMDSG